MGKYIVLILYVGGFLGAAMLTDGWQAAPASDKAAGIGAALVLGIGMFIAAWRYEIEDKEDRDLEGED